MNSPILIEPGVKYFLKETLKQCNFKKKSNYNLMFNIGLFVTFIGLFSGIIYFKYKNKQTPEDKGKIKDIKQYYFLKQIKKIKQMQKEENNKFIASMPKFENPFTTLHENFYNV